MRWPIRLVLVLAASAMPVSPAAAGELGTLKPTQTLALLGGRLTARLPQGARVEPRRASIMAAAESVDEETRVVLERGPEKLVLMAYEMFALAGDDFEAAVRRQVKTWQAKGGAYGVEPFKAGTGLRAMAVVPPTLDLGREAVHVLGLFVARPDRTVQYLGFFVNPTAGKDAPGCHKLVRAIGATVADGKGGLASGAGQRRLRAYGGDLVATVPAGTVATVQPGPDFLVHHLRRLAPLGGSGVTVGLYVGGHPNYQYRQSDAAPQVRKTSGRLLGTPIDWHAWTRTVDGVALTTVEGIAPLPGSARDFVHAFATGPEGPSLAEARRVLDTLKWEKAK